jgi:hypothetical protein
VRLIALALLAPLVAACATPYVKRAPGHPPPDKQPAPTLLGSFVVGVDDAAADDLDVSTAVNVVQNLLLHEFGEAAQPRVEAELERRGFKLLYDAEVASTLDLFPVAKDNIVATALIGHWVYGQGSDVDPDKFRELHLFGDDKATEVGRQLSNMDGAKDKDYFAFTGVKIMKPSGCGCFGVWCWAKPRLRVNLVVLDRAGKIVYDAQGVGVGNTSVLVVDRTPGNLGVALDQALFSMREEEELPLKY